MITPNKEEFRKLALKGNLIPVYAEIIADTETPVSAYRKIAFDKNGRPLKYSFLLESVEGGENVARYSFLGADPVSVFTHRNGKGVLISGKTQKEIKGKDVFEQIHNLMSAYKPVVVKGLPRFTGGAVGYFSYDVISEVEPSVVQPKMKPVDVPEAVFMLTDSFFVFDRVKHTIKIIVQAHIDGKGDTGKIYDAAVEKIKKLSDRLKQPLTIPPADIEAPEAQINVKSNKTLPEYRAMLAKAKQYILDGDIIQTVLSQRFSVKTKSSPLSVYRSLRMLNPSPYMFLLNCDDFSLVGASPELNARCDNRKITIRPIAGTRKRGASPEEDEALEKELLADPKERAEHIMLVDLARNDIGRIAETGSVKVEKLMIVEKYSHVMHIVSEVTGTLAKKYDSDSVMRSTFPAGTLSGAPKIRAMQIISELEKEKRCTYGGAVAYYSFDGNVDSCITIRTALIKDGTAYIQAGGGIVADSVPETEYEETCNKAKAMMRAIAMAKNFEK
ncbi:MAG TPA: anthranilate synthase component I [Lentisphaeria bacterium]|nr:MAG: anthranilate synthase component I [Lentisphaerae bacterium GWF2_49_21]HBC85975.1 anthranilate synthase component I [Lentisphaeria bacterium]